MEGDIFRIIVPLDETYSYDFLQINGISDTICDTVDTNQYVISDTIRKGHPNHLQALLREYYLLHLLSAFCGRGTYSIMRRNWGDAFKEYINRCDRY